MMLFHATNIWLYATSCNLVSSTQNPCYSNPCRNSSTCVAKCVDDNYKCTCTPGLKAKNCSKAVGI